MPWRLGLLTAGVLVAALAIIVVGSSGAGDNSRATTTTRATATTSASQAPGSASATAAADPAPHLRALRVTLTVPGGPGGSMPVPGGFLGLSLEFSAARAYTGDDPDHVDPVLLSLIRSLDPGQAPVLRIGGDSTDRSFVPAHGVRAPSYVDYALTPGWLATTTALVRDVGARTIMGLNLAADDPRLAAAEAHAYVRALGASRIEALEIGNEPNVYGKLAVGSTVLGMPVRARSRTFGFTSFHRQFAAVAAAVPGLRLAGPALAVGPKADTGSWVHQMPGFLRAEHRLGVFTVHRYPLRNCNVGPSSPQYPTIAHLLSPYATVGLARSLAPWIGIARATHRTLRVDELNSVACRGATGVSDTFASSLWSVDALFSLVAAGVGGVNIHTLPGAAYAPFSFTRAADGRWSAAVAPLYYGLQLFAQAAPAGARLLTLAGAPHSQTLSAWATRAPDGRIRLVLIDKEPGRAADVTLRPPPGTTATVERLRAPSVSARTGVTLGGRSYGAQTRTGRLAPPIVRRLAAARSGDYSVRVPGASAALVTLTPAGGR